MKHGERYLWFDLIRGLSAIAVCAGHLRAALFVDYSQIENPTILHKLFYFATGSGHQAVLVFFVLSGFFVGGSVLRNRGRFGWGPYLTARLTRLHVVFVPALILTFLLDLAIGRLDPKILAGEYGDMWGSGPGDEYSTSLATLLGNLLFVHTIVVPVFGSNGPSWSLAFEFWYYMLFPLLMCALGVVRPGGRIGRIAFGGLTAALVLWLPRPILLGFLVWLLGVLVWVLSSRPAPRRAGLLAVSGLVVFLGSLIYGRMDGLQAVVHVHRDVATGVGFFLFAITLLHIPGPRRFGGAFERLSVGLAEFSYSLYVFHFPVVLLLVAAIYGPGRMAPDFSGFCQFFFWLAVILAGAIGFWWLFERRTEDVRRFLTACRERTRAATEAIRVTTSVRRPRDAGM